MRQRLMETVGEAYGDESVRVGPVLVAGMLMRVREMLLQEIDAMLGEFGTSHARYQVLSIVCRFPSGLQLRDIADRASVHPTTMTATVDRLERDGLIERHSDPGDRRRTLAIATPQRYELFAKASKALTATEYGLAHLDAETTKGLLDGLDKIAAELEGHTLSE